MYRILSYEIIVKKSERKLIFTITLNILFWLWGCVKLDYGNVSSRTISRGCCLHHSLWPTYLTVTWSKGKSIYFLLNYIISFRCCCCFVFFSPSNCWKDACVIILPWKKINLPIIQNGKDSSSVLSSVLTARFIFPLKCVSF